MYVSCYPTIARCICLLFFAVLFPLIARAQIDNSEVVTSKAYQRLLETEKEFEVVKAQGDSCEIAEYYYLLGKRNVGINNYLKARHWFFRSLEIREPLGLSQDVGKIYMRLMECETYLGNEGNFDHAMRYARKAMQHFAASNFSLGLIMATRAFGGSHLWGWRAKVRNKKVNFPASLDSAQYYFNKSLQLSQKANLPLEIGLDYHCMAEVWMDKREYQKAYESRLLAIRNFNKTKSQQPNVEVYWKMGDDLLKTGKLAEAKVWLDRSRQLSDSLNLKSYGYLAQLAATYENYYRQTGNLKAALASQKEQYEYKLRMEQAHRVEALQGMDLLLQNEKRNLVLQNHRKALENHRQKAEMQLWLIIVASALCVVSALAGIFFFRLFKKYKTLSHINANLVREQSHRFKNNLQSVSDMISLQMAQVGDPKALHVLEESLRRVEAMSLVHKKLYGGKALAEVELKTYIPDLVKNVLSGYDLREVKLEFELDDILLHADKAIPLGLILNELTTNAAKYAFPGNPDPILKITCKQHLEYLEMHFQDNGPGFVSADHRKSFGLKLIDLLTHSLEGKMVFDGRRGSSYRLLFESVSRFSKVSL